MLHVIEQPTRHLFFTGKGGVGKTTVAAAVAVELARRGHDVHLSTTDPAAHLAEAVEADVEGLTLSRIDLVEETRRYTEYVLRTKGKDLDEKGRKLLEEDLRSPCTEEVAVFHAFSRVVREAARGFVVLDTAPTGHTLLLLDQTGAYHREVARNAARLPGRVTTPLMRLQDPAYAKLLLVTLPETTPVLEAAALQTDLRRAEIEPYAWVVNQSLAAAEPTDPLLAARARAEAPRLAAVTDEHAARTARSEPSRAARPFPTPYLLTPDTSSPCFAGEWQRGGVDEWRRGTSCRLFFRSSNPKNRWLTRTFSP